MIQGDECGSLADFSAPNLDVQYSFSNFSFKVRPKNLSCSFFFRCRMKMIDDGGFFLHSSFWIHCVILQSVIISIISVLFVLSELIAACFNQLWSSREEHQGVTGCLQVICTVTRQFFFNPSTNHYALAYFSKLTVPSNVGFRIEVFDVSSPGSAASIQRIAVLLPECRGRLLLNHA